MIRSLVLLVVQGVGSFRGILECRIAGYIFAQNINSVVS